MKPTRRCPPTFAPDPSVVAVGRRLGMSDEDIDLELETMRDHEFRRPYHDWQAVARNWLRNAVKYRRERVQARAMPSIEQVRDFRSARQGDGNIEQAFKGRFGMSYEDWAMKVGR